MIHPMIYVGIALVLLITITPLACYLYTRKRPVECPNCANVWHPKFITMLFSFRTTKGNLIKCPHCNNKVPVHYLNKKESSSKIIKDTENTEDDWD